MSNKTKDRGTLLKVLLVISFLWNIFGVYVVLKNYPTASPSPIWYQAFILISLLLFSIALIGIWKYMKWAVYLYITNFIISTLLRIILPPQIGNDPFAQKVVPYILSAALIISFIYNALFFYAISKKWSLFK